MKDLLQKSWFQITLSLVLIVIIGSSLAAPVSWVAKAIAGSLDGSALLENKWIEDLHDSVANSPFTRYYDRAVLIAAILVLVPLRKWFGVGGEDGPARTRIRPRFAGGWLGAGIQWGSGFVLAAAALLILAMIYVFTDIFHPRPFSPGGPTWQGNLTSAIVVGLLEEALFRGLILAIVLKSMRPIPALFFVSFLFAVLHFVHPPEENLPRAVTWIDGWKMTGASLQRLFQPQYFIAELCTLFAVGWVLGSIRLRSGSIWIGAGIHAGWVFALKEFSRMYHGPAGLPEAASVLVGENLRTGLAPLTCVLATGLVAVWWLRWSGRERDATDRI